MTKRKQGSDHHPVEPSSTPEDLVIQHDAEHPAQPPAPSFRQALLRVLPSDHRSMLLMIILLAGIWMYATHHDSWLLATFLYLFTGTSTIQQVHP